MEKEDIYELKILSEALLISEKNIKEKDNTIFNMVMEIDKLREGRECDDEILIQVFQWFKENNYTVEIVDGNVKVEKSNCK